MTSSNGNMFRVTVPLCGEFTALNKRRVNNPEAGDLGLHRTHYDVIVMTIVKLSHIYDMTL